MCTHDATCLPLNLWAEAINTTIYILNRTVLSGKGTTPYQQWTGKIPCLGHMRIFGSEGYAHVPKQFTQKLDVRARKIILVGYQDDSTNYRVLDPTSKKITIARNVVFNEQIGQSSVQPEEDAEIILPPAKNIVLEQAEGNEVDDRNENAVSDDEEFEDAIHDEDEKEASGSGLRNICRKLRDRSTIKPPSRFKIDVLEYNIPNTYEEAVNSKEAAQWARAVETELQAHEKNNTWTIVSRTPEMKVIDSKWVFKVKMDPNRKKSQRFKARLCARGFLQQHGVDYTETFAPVVRYDSLRTLLAIVATDDLELAQFDVQTAFLYGELNKDVYMEIPEGLNNERSGKNARENSVCKLNKALYGLKQSPRCWNKKFTSFLSQFEFKPTEADKCVFISRINGTPVYLALFIDDGLLATKCKETLKIIISWLNKAFEIIVSDSSVFVGVQIEKNRKDKTLWVHQGAYLKKNIRKI